MKRNKKRGARKLLTMQLSRLLPTTRATWRWYLTSRGFEWYLDIGAVAVVPNFTIEKHFEKWRWKWRRRKGRIFIFIQALSFSECRNFELCWFQICFQIFHSFIGSKVIALESWPKRPILTYFSGFCPTLRVCNSWSNEDMKNLITDLESARSIVFTL